MRRKQNEDIHMKTITTTVWFLDTPAEVIIILNSKAAEVHSSSISSGSGSIHTLKIIKSSSYIVCINNM